MPGLLFDWPLFSLSQAMASESNTYVSWLQQYWAPEMYGYELVDSISYHTLQLQDLNRKVRFDSRSY